ncbi:glycoside hydrolase family 101 beta sandwich domain-containing protein, partial [Streptomyces sp. NPDC096068]|uniref:glycoside hydrolase family 101 beta sandwich domain-containing protein n=1 Tax=Streptomyces sp. NPDC096068 TaxID=3155424 RepID=UPI00332FD361
MRVDEGQRGREPVPARGPHPVEFRADLRRDADGRENGRKVLDGERYLLPWDGGKKLYHYNKAGGTT